MNKPKYNSSQTSFFADLKKDVAEQVRTTSVSRKFSYIKAVLLLSLFAILLTCMWLSVTTSLYIVLAILLGVLSLPIVLNVGHESVHATFSNHKRINNLGRSVFYLLGTSSYFWELRHISSHHVFSNVSDWDMDIEQSSLIRLADQQEYKSRHKYQHWYMPLAFCFYTLIWFFIRDFKDIKTQVFGIKVVDRHPRIEIAKLLFAKLFHLMCFIGIPLLLGISVGLVIWGFIVFHISASVVTTFALVSTHVGEEQEIVENNDVLPYSWAEHQLMTTADFGTSSKWMTHYFGGFNHHIAHHLFPHLSHIHYPSITPLIEKHALANGLEYSHYSNLFRTAISHIRRLRVLSIDPDI